jgi:hypothetical protein
MRRGLLCRSDKCRLARFQFFQIGYEKMVGDDQRLARIPRRRPRLLDQQPALVGPRPIVGWALTTSALGAKRNQCKHRGFGRWFTDSARHRRDMAASGPSISGMARPK